MDTIRLRLHLLELAQNTGGWADEVVERARIYELHVHGLPEAEAPEPPAPKAELEEAVEQVLGPAYTEAKMRVEAEEAMRERPELFGGIACNAPGEPPQTDYEIDTSSIYWEIPKGTDAA